MSSSSSFASLKFDCRSLRELPIDASYRTEQRQVPNAVFALVKPTPVRTPRLVAKSDSVAKDLLEVDLDDDDSAASFLAGCEPEFGQTAAHCYAGHQFGYFSGQLGDGATMYLGEIVNSKHERWELQFKGAGLTPFSRTADGRKVLRSSIREFLCSEHMHALGVPTTRALSLCDSQSTVVRDQFYDGHAARERCAVIVRVAPSFLRFGSFELAKSTDRHTGRAGPSPGNFALVRQLVDYTRKHFYPETVDSGEAFLLEVARRTGELLARWQCVGFCHGVMNTDNMSILGLTLDYGPFGFMEQYDPEFVPNLSDHEGSYRFERQPTVGLFNLKVLAKELTNAGVVDNEDGAVDAKLEQTYRDSFFDTFGTVMHHKLGVARQPDNQLVFELLTVMRRTGADYTMTFRALAKMRQLGDFDEMLSECLAVGGGGDDGEANKTMWTPWLTKYFAIVDAEDKPQRAEEMNRANPVFVLRNYVAQRAIDDAEQGKYDELNKVLGFCVHPFDDAQPGLLEGKYHRPSKAYKCDSVSCSS